MNMNMKIEMEVQKFIKSVWVTEDSDSINIESLREEFIQMSRDKSRSAAFVEALGDAIGDMTTVFYARQGIPL